jgi:hypothetical protein
MDEGTVPFYMKIQKSRCIYAGWVWRMPSSPTIFGST